MTGAERRARSAGIDPANLPYGPGNPDYENDGRKCDSCGQVRFNEQECTDTLCAFVPRMRVYDCPKCGGETATQKLRDKSKGGRRKVDVPVMLERRISHLRGYVETITQVPDKEI